LGGFLVITEHQQALTRRPHTRIRPFYEADYPRLVEILNRSNPADLWGVEEARHRDTAWDHIRHTRVRVVAENRNGYAVAMGRFNHMVDEFHPRKYYVDIVVDPAHQGRGFGKALYEHIMAELQRRGAIAARAGVYSTAMGGSLSFLTRRGFVEVQRGWELRLAVGSFDYTRAPDIARRAAEQGIALTTLAAEQKCDLDALRKAYALTDACDRDVPAADEVTETSFEYFLDYVVHSPNALPEAFFLAVIGNRYVGLSAMFKPLALPGVIEQGLTGVLRDYRGRGIAQALKIETIRYARDHGYAEIRTGNDVRNGPMLRINEALGFVKHHQWINLEKALRPEEVSVPRS
jgi:GNAT superfamily N-acetyltransferase